MKSYFYYLCEDNGIIRISANSKPSRTNIPKRGTWIVNEYINSSNSGKWIMPCYSEITWGRLSKMQYIGSLKKVEGI